MMNCYKSSFQECITIIVLKIEHTKNQPPYCLLQLQQSGTVIKFDNVVTSQHGINLELGEFSERVPSLRQFFGCVRAIYPELQVVNIREQ